MKSKFLGNVLSSEFYIPLASTDSGDIIDTFNGHFVRLGSEFLKYSLLFEDKFR